MDTGIFTFEEAKSHVYSENLAEMLSELFDMRTPIIDMGCGDGAYVDWLDALGFDIFGIEGTEEIKEIAVTDKIVIKDLTEPIDYSPAHDILCLEVAEHIPKELEGEFLENLTRNVKDKIVLSWAVPGQGGVRHVNERSNEYVIGAMKMRGFKLNKDETFYLRNGLDSSDPWWFKNTLMVFYRVK